MTVKLSEPNLDSYNISSIYSDMDLKSNSRGIVVYIDTPINGVTIWLNVQMKTDQKNKLSLCVNTEVLTVEMIIPNITIISYYRLRW